MRIGLMSGSVTRPDSTLNAAIAEARDAERRGFAFLSVPNVFGHDAMTAIAIAGHETSTLELMTGVVPSPPRHPMAIAQQALSTQAACGGRFVLGIGLSHQVVIETMMGLSYARPALQMREYLEVLMPLVNGKPAAFQGELYRVAGQIQVGDASRVPVLVAALGPLMLKLTGELADGTATWMTGTKTLGDFTIPTLARAASAAGRPTPRVVAGLPVALTNDVASARAHASRAFQMYGTLPSYRAMLDREGAADPADVALIGDEAMLRAELDRLRDAGVTDLSAACFGTGDGGGDRTIDFLQSEIQG